MSLLFHPLNFSSKKQELELIISCAGTHLSIERAAKVRQLAAAKLDWDYVLAIAEEHGVIPLLYWQLKHLSPATVPSSVWQKLSQAFDCNAYRNIALTAELARIERLFTNQNIPCLAFKGAVLAQLAYGNLALRQFVDLDLLIPESAVSQASEILKQEGYKPQFQLTQQQQQKYLTLRCEHAFWQEEKQISVDLHWAILPQHFSFSPEDKLIWDNPQQVSFGKSKIATLSAENMLLFLCSHSAKHDWSHLCWLCDIAQVLQTNPNLDWELIAARTGKIGTRRMLNLSLYLVHTLLDVTLPAAIEKQISSDPKIISLAIQVQQGMFENYSSWIGSFPVAKIYLQTMESWRDWLWYWVDAIMTPTPLEWKILPLPNWLFPLYYPLRLGRLILKSSWQVSSHQKSQ